MRRTLTSALLALTALVSSGAPAVATGAAEPDADTLTWGITPATADGPDERVSFRLELEPGTEHTDHVAVTNFSEQAVTFALAASDGVLTDAGDFNLLPATEVPTGAGAWIDIADEVHIEAGESAVVPYTVRVPADALPGDHPGGIVASLAASTLAEQGGAIGVDAGVGARIHLRVAGEVAPSIALTGVEATYTGSWNPLRPGVLDVEWTVRNEGNVRLGAEQVLAVAGQLGLDPGVEPHAVGLQREVLPGQSTTLRTAVEAWPTFRLDARLTATSNVVGEDVVGEALPSASAEVSVPAVPWPHLAVLALLVLAVVGLLVRRRRRRARLARALAAARAEAPVPSAARR